MLKIATADGDANTLNAAYRDTVHDAFTDSDDLQDNWNGPDSADTGSDSGTDHSTDGDNGSETAYFHAQATLPDWQADSSSGDTPTWQVTSVGGTIDGTAAVNAGATTGLTPMSRPRTPQIPTRTISTIRPQARKRLQQR